MNFGGILRFGRGRELVGAVAMGVRLVRDAAPRLWVETSALQVVSGLAAVGAVVLGGRLAERLVEIPEVGAAGTTSRLGWFLLVTLVALSASIVKGERQRLLAELTSRHATDVVLRAAASAKLADYESPEFHDQLIRALTSAYSRPVQLSGAILGLVSSSVTIVGLAITLLAVSPVLLGVVVLGVVPLWWTASRASRLSYGFARSQSERDRERSYLMDALAQRRTAGEVRVFGIGDALRSRIRAIHSARIDDLMPVSWSRMGYGLAGALISVALAGALILTLIQMFDSGVIGVDQAVIAVGAFLVLSQRLQTLTSSAASVLENALFLEDVEEFNRRDTELTQETETRRLDSIELRGVSFRYPASESDAVTDIDLQLRRGELVALVGENGSGKTTLARLLALLYEPRCGLVLVNGTPLDPAMRRSLRRRISVVDQDFMRLLLTARENIALGDITADPRSPRIEESGRFAGIDEAIQRWPNAYDTRLGTEYSAGQELSGGQWQRMAIARAWFRDADLLILDEPTSALDPRAEVDLIEQIKALAQDKLVILISHRFGTVSTADRIVVMHEGSVVEQGAHRNLLEIGGIYSSLYRIQADPFRTPAEEDPTMPSD